MDQNSNDDALRRAAATSDARQHRTSAFVLDFFSQGMPLSGDHSLILVCWRRWQAALRSISSLFVIVVLAGVRHLTRR
jgi:hypothetical protein